MYSPDATQCPHLLEEGKIGDVWKRDVWKRYGEVTATLLGLPTGVEEVSDKDVAVPERFTKITILLYDRTSSLTEIDEAQFEFFTKRG